MQFENLLYEIKDRIAAVTINRPDKGNTLNTQTLIDLTAAFSELKINPDVWVVILTGSGTRFFVAGADINELQDLNAATGTGYAQRGHEVFALIENLGKPVIAAINGFALGGGCELALACTMRIAADNARLGQPETKLGIIPGFGGTQRLPRLVGKGRALEMLTTGEVVDAAEALSIGLVNKVVAQAELMATAEMVAQKIAANAPLAVRFCLDAVNRGLDVSMTEGLKLEAELFGLACATEDMKIGMAAFLEKKKKADFTGK